MDRSLTVVSKASASSAARLTPKQRIAAELAGLRERLAVLDKLIALLDDYPDAA
jgi:hypothetical protein